MISKIFLSVSVALNILGAGALKLSSESNSFPLILLEAFLAETGVQSYSESCSGLSLTFLPATS